MTLAYWAFLLILQNAAFTWVSRARNSGSIGYHAIASVFSNGIFFTTNLMLIGSVVMRPNMTPSAIFALGAIYVASTVTGSVLMHIVSIRWLEAGKRKVGA